MSIDDLDKKLVIGILVGAILGFASALLLAPGPRSRRRETALDRVASSQSVPSPRGQRKTERAGRTLMERVERIRSAGL